MKQAAFKTLLTVSLAIVLVFLTIPVLAIFVEAGPRELISNLGDPAVVDALRISLGTSLIAVAVIVLLGTPAAYMLATRQFRGRSLLVTLIELPLVMPPAVAGIGLLVAFGPQGLFGGMLDDAGVELVLQTSGVIVALIFVAAPFYIRQTQTALEAVSPDLLAAARTLGASEAGAMWKVSLPAARNGIAAGLALAWARSLGEFGATLMFAGSVQGVTQTMPLAIYAEFSTNLNAALAVSAILIAMAAALLLGVKLLTAGGLPHARR